LITRHPIELAQVTHRFSDKPVLSAISLSFLPEKITAILGKSGSGKSTLLQIINGMIIPDAGQVKIFGEPIAYYNIHSLRLQMGYVVQQIGLFPHLTIEQNITLLGRVTHKPAEAIRKRVQYLMEMVQLPLIHLEKYPHQLSGGEQQRAGLCRAMLLEPPVLLMDEPFASLDDETKHGIYQHLLAIQKNEPRTIVMVSHDWEEAITLADQFVWLQDGAVKASGDKMELHHVRTTSTSKG
jgi:osmoprotectant transport system ATP-binding protein